MWKPEPLLDYIFRIQYHWDETFRYAASINRISGRQADIEQEIKSSIVCYDANITNTHTSLTVFIRKILVRFWNPKGMTVSLIGE
jgi:hypothetical protein